MKDNELSKKKVSPFNSEAFSSHDHAFEYLVVIRA